MAKKVSGKRIGALIIDTIIVSIIVSLFSSISFLNPNIDKMKEQESKYTEYASEVIKNPTKITEMEETTDDISYDLSYYSVYEDVIELVVLFLYFSLFQFFNNGQTVGKMLTKIRVVSNKKKKLRLSQVIIRSAIINEILVSALLIISILFLNKSSYLVVSEILDLISFGLILAAIIMILTRSDGRGLHDLLGDTIVLSCEDAEEFEKGKKVKEADVVEKKKEK